MIDQLDACDTLTFYSPLTSKVLPDWVPTYWPLMKPFWMKREGSSRPSWIIPMTSVEPKKMGQRRLTGFSEVTLGQLDIVRDPFGARRRGVS